MRAIHILRKHLKGEGGIKKMSLMLIFSTKTILTKGGGVKKARNCAYVIYEWYLEVTINNPMGVEKEQANSNFRRIKPKD